MPLLAGDLTATGNFILAALQMVLGDLLELRTSLVSCAVVRTSSISSSLGNGGVAPPSDCELLECASSSGAYEPSVVWFFSSSSPSSESEESAGLTGAFLPVTFDLRVIAATATPQFSKVNTCEGPPNLPCSTGSVFVPGIGSPTSTEGQAFLVFEYLVFGRFVGWSAGGKSFAFRF